MSILADLAAAIPVPRRRPAIMHVLMGLVGPVILCAFIWCLFVGVGYLEPSFRDQVENHATGVLLGMVGGLITYLACVFSWRHWRVLSR